MKRLLILVAAAAWMAPQARAGVQGLHASIGGIAMVNSLEQGGSGPSGFTLLTQGEVFWNFPFVGVGAFIGFDKQGSVETDINIGPKIELHYGPFFVESGYGLILSRAFSDRSISGQGGQSFYAGPGFRLILGKDADLGGVFVQVAYRFRVFSVRNQDGAALSEPIRQFDGYPIVSVGLAL